VVRGAIPGVTITTEQILDVLRQKSKDQILETWAAIAAPLTREVADQVVDEVCRLTGVKPRALQAALQDARGALRREQKDASMQQRVGKRQTINYQPEDRTRQAHEVEALIVNAAKAGAYIEFGGQLAQ
jgi:hypothetical protein